MYTKSFDIVINPTGSLFAKTLQTGLKAKVKNKVFRRATPKVVAARPQLLSRRGNVLRQAQPGFTRPHFSITQRTLNKVEQFERFVAAGVSAPKHAVSREAARNLDCKTLFARTLINSTNGRGIVEFETNSEQYPVAPLYTEYIPKKSEFRVHVFNGKVIDIQQKKKKKGVDEEDRNTRVRNLQNGYVYTRGDIVPPDGIGELAIAACAAVGYAYGAVDIIYNEKRNQCFVLEVNSRPGLMGTTLDKYVDSLINTYELERK